MAWEKKKERGGRREGEKGGDEGREGGKFKKGWTGEMTQSVREKHEDLSLDPLAPT